MPNVHIFGKNKKEASDIERRIFKTIEYDKKPYLENIVITTHEKTTVHNREKEDQPYILIVGDHLDDIKDLAKRLVMLEMDIEVQRIDAFYPAESCR